MNRRYLKYRNILALISGLGLIIFLISVPPGGIYSFIIFYTLVGSVLFMILTNFTDTERSIRISLSIVIFLLIRQIKQLNLLNLLIILAINAIVEILVRNGNGKPVNNKGKKLVKIPRGDL